MEDVLMRRPSRTTSGAVSGRREAREDLKPKPWETSRLRSACAEAYCTLYAWRPTVRTYMRALEDATLVPRSANGGL